MRGRHPAGAARTALADEEAVRAVFRVFQGESVYEKSRRGVNIKNLSFFALRRASSDSAASPSVVLFFALVALVKAKLAGLKRSRSDFSCLVHVKPIEGQFYDFKPSFLRVAISAYLLLNLFSRSSRNRNRSARLLARLSIRVARLTGHYREKDRAVGDGTHRQRRTG